MSCQHSTSTQNFHSSIQGKAVHKDQCVKCFFDARVGLNVCLTCLQGFCDSNGNSHTQEHFQNTSHPLYVHIKSTAQEQSSEDQKEITKLAIGVEGGATNNEIKYTDTFTVVCKGCSNAIDQASFINLIKSIELAGSVNQNVEVNQWEEDIRPCEHG